MPSRLTSTGAKMSGWAKACPQGFKWSDSSNKCVKTERERRHADVFFSMGPLRGGHMHKGGLKTERVGSAIVATGMKRTYTLNDLPMPKAVFNPTGYKIKKSK
jgi:hypothetical protein